MPTDWKKYLPFIAIGGVAIWLILRLSKSGSSNQVVNRVIPVQEPNDTTALSQIQAQFELGKMQIAANSELSGRQVDAERQRLEFANRALEIQGNYGLEGLKIESAKAANQAQLQSDLTKIALDSQNYETQLRANAAGELLRQQQTSARNNSLLQLGSLLAQLLKPQSQSQSRPSGSSGSTGGGTTPPFNPNAQRRPQQSALTSFFARYLPNYNAPLSYQDYDFLGYASELDLIPYYQNEVDAYDNWLNYQTPSFGTVTSSYELFDPRGWSWEDEFAIDPDSFYF